MDTRKRIGRCGLSPVILVFAVSILARNVHSNTAGHQGAINRNCGRLLLIRKKKYMLHPYYYVFVWICTNSAMDTPCVNTTPEFATAKMERIGNPAGPVWFKNSRAMFKSWRAETEMFGNDDWDTYSYTLTYLLEENNRHRPPLPTVATWIINQALLNLTSLLTAVVQLSAFLFTQAHTCPVYISGQIIWIFRRIRMSWIKTDAKPKRFVLTKMVFKWKWM